jgi:hypothetical protein
MPRFGRKLATVFLCAAMIGTGAWGALALWHRAPAGWPALASAAAWALACLVLLSQLFTHRRTRAVLAFAACTAVMTAWWDSIRPSDDRDWAPDVARTALPRIEGDTLVVDNVRDFAWTSADQGTPRWEERRYALADLQGVDLFLSYWAGEAIAHAIVSFQFASARPLAFSIEIRREKDEAYSAIAGFFKSYELAFIAADERDVVKVRATLRGEDVRLFRLAASPAAARRLLQAYVAEAQSLARKPQWYDTATANCTTMIFQMIQTFNPGVPLDWRVYLSGYLPGYLYDHGAVDRAVPLDALVAASHIGPRAAGPAPDDGFSARIREGVPRPAVTRP